MYHVLYDITSYDLLLLGLATLICVINEHQQCTEHVIYIIQIYLHCVAQNTTRKTEDISAITLKFCPNSEDYSAAN